MTTVYIDVLFFVNLIVNMMLYASACLMRRKKIIGWRILCASAVGAVYSCAVFISNISPLWYNAAAVLLYVLCTWLVMGYQSVTAFIKNTAATLLSAFVFAGIFYLIYRYADVGSVVVFNHNVLYIDIPVFALLCVSAICFGVMALVSRAFTQVVGAATEYEVTITLFERQITLPAKVDTGNSMVDAITGTPVLLAEGKRIGKLLPAHMDAFMACGDVSKIPACYRSRLRLITCKTATGEGMLTAFRPDGISLIYNGKEICIHNILIAVSKTNLNDVGLLLSPLIFREVDGCETLD